MKKATKQNTLLHCKWSRTQQDRPDQQTADKFNDIIGYWELHGAENYIFYYVRIAIHRGQWIIKYFHTVGWVLFLCALRCGSVGLSVDLSVSVRSTSSREQNVPIPGRVCLLCLALQSFLFNVWASGQTTICDPYRNDGCHLILYRLATAVYERHSNHFCRSMPCVSMSMLSYGVHLSVCLSVTFVDRLCRNE